MILVTENLLHVTIQLNSCDLTLKHIRPFKYTAVDYFDVTTNCKNEKAVWSEILICLIIKSINNEVTNILYAAINALRRMIWQEEKNQNVCTIVMEPLSMEETMN